MGMRLLSHFRTLRVSIALGLLGLSPGTALAQYPDAPPEAAAPDDAGEPDGARFRGAIQAEGGVLSVPGDFTLGIAGVSAQLGAQITHLVGVYAVPQLDVVFGELGGVNVGGAVIVDFTFADIFTVGAGPDVSLFAAIGADATGASAAGGEMYGGRLHLGVYPYVGRGEDGIRRKAFAIGLDVRALGGAIGSATVNTAAGSASAAATNFILIPMLSLGYQAF